MRARPALFLPLALPLVLLAAACARTGDFGRPVSPPTSTMRFYDRALALGNDLMPSPSAVGSSDEERELRARAHRFLTPVGEDGWLGSAVGQWRAAGWPGTDWVGGDASAYFAGLTRGEQRSTASLWWRLITDISNDAETVEPFAQTAFQVAQADRVRLASLAYMPEGKTGEWNAFQARAEANRNAIARVHDAVHHRIAAYEHALGRLRLEAPDPLQWQAEEALFELQRRAGPIGEVLGLYERPGEPAVFPTGSEAPGPIRVIAPPPIVELSGR